MQFYRRYMVLGFAVEVVVLCQGLAKKSCRVFSRNGGVFSVYEFAWSLNFAVLQMGVWTQIVCLHKAQFPHLAQLFWCGCSVMKLTFYLHQTTSWHWLVWTYSPVFTLPGYGQTYQLPQHTNNAQTPPYPKYCGHMLSSRIPGLYRIQGIEQQTIPTLNRKQLEKQRVELSIVQRPSYPVFCSLVCVHELCLVNTKKQKSAKNGEGLRTPVP